MIVVFFSSVDFVVVWFYINYIVLFLWCGCRVWEFGIFLWSWLYWFWCCFTFIEELESGVTGTEQSSWCDNRLCSIFLPLPPHDSFKKYTKTSQANLLAVNAITTHHLCPVNLLLHSPTDRHSAFSPRALPAHSNPDFRLSYGTPVSFSGPFRRLCSWDLAVIWGTRLIRKNRSGDYLKKRMTFINHIHEGRHISLIVCFTLHLPVISIILSVSMTCSIISCWIRVNLLFWIFKVSSEFKFSNIMLGNTLILKEIILKNLLFFLSPSFSFQFTQQKIMF